MLPQDPDTKKQLLGTFFKLFIPLAVASLLVSGYLLFQEIDDQKDFIKFDGITDVSSNSRAIERSLAGSVRNLLYLATDPELIKVLGKPPTSANLGKLSASYMRYSMAHPTYFKIRWIDEQGMERLIVRNMEGEISLADNRELENKQARYYFQQSIDLQPGEVYVSPLDLDVEHGKVLEPYLPVVRISTPILDAKQRRHGVLVITLNARDLLARVNTNATPTKLDAMLLNKDGYWLKNSGHPDDEWGFMFDQPKTLAAKHPEAWQKISASERGQFEDNDGMWSFETVYPLRSGKSRISEKVIPIRTSNNVDQYYWKMVSYASKDQVLDIHSRVLRTTAIESIAALLLLLLGAWYFAKMRVSQLKARIDLYIAARKHATQMATRDVEARRYAILNTVADGIITFGSDGVIEEFAANAEHVFGYTPDEVKGKNINLLLPNFHHELVNSQPWHLNLTRLSTEEDHDIEGQRKDGHTFPIELAVSEMQLGEQRYYTCMMRDVSRRVKIQKELISAKQEADAANKAKGEFLANMSHEIRTPMNSIIGFSHLCLQLELGVDQRSYLEKVYFSANSLLAIINDTLDYSKIESDKLEIESAPFNLNEVFRNVSFNISLLAEEKNLELMIDNGIGIPQSLIGDSLRLGQVLSNLASNAVKFTDSGEIEIKVEANRKNHDQVVLRFSVRDTGIGLSDEQIGKLFQYFSQADLSTTRKYGGTGLGLAISKHLVELMGGRIWVESIPGKGSMFSFEIPFSYRSEAALSTAQISGLKVLVINANETARQLIKGYFLSFDAEVLAVPDEPQGIIEIRRADKIGDPFNFIAIDSNVLGTNGLEIVEHIKLALPKQRRPRVIYFSGHKQAEMFSGSEHRKLVDAFINKPITAFSVLNAITACDSDRNEARSVAAHGTTIPNLSGLHVLLVEDNQFNQLLAKILLTRAGVRVSIAVNGIEAIKAVRLARFDAVLMDIQMPEMDGLEATRNIRKAFTMTELPIIAMTANAMRGDRERYIAAGMNEYISKPIHYETLYSTLIQFTYTDAQTIKNVMATTEQPGGTPPHFDSNIAIARVGSKDVFLSMLSKFAPSYSQSVKSVGDAIDSADWSLAERSAHTLKGAAATVGASALSELAKQLETAIAARETKKYVELIASLDEEMSRALTLIKNYLKENGVEIESMMKPSN